MERLLVVLKARSKLGTEAKPALHPTEAGNRAGGGIRLVVLRARTIPEIELLREDGTVPASR